MTDIPKKVTQTADDGSQLPEAVAEMPQETEAPEAIPYLISFAMYNESMCEISELTSNKARKALETFKTIGTKIHSEADFQRYHVDRIPVRREGDYRKLYRRLGDDIDLKEIKLQDGARIFYFDIEDKRTFYVVAITQNHLETDKVRR
jgi:hypothetical protein